MLSLVVIVSASILQCCSTEDPISDFNNNNASYGGDNNNANYNGNNSSYRGGIDSCNDGSYRGGNDSGYGGGINNSSNNFTGIRS